MRSSLSSHRLANLVVPATPRLVDMFSALRTPLGRSAGGMARASSRSATATTLRQLSSSAPRFSSPSYNNIIVSQPKPSVTLITLNRPKALNALNSELFHEINAATAAADDDAAVGAIVITGSEKAFAAGADIKEMKDKEFAAAYKSNFLGHWTKLTTIRKPIIAAVSGHAVSLTNHSPSVGSGREWEADVALCSSAVDVSWQ